MRVKAVIFDMDGVLADSMKFHIESWNYAFHQFDIFPSKEDFALLEGMSYKETIDVICKKYDVALNQDQKDEVYLTKKNKLSEIFTFEIYPLIPDFLSFLQKQDVKLAVVSGANKEFVHSIINKFFKDYFGVVITSNDVTQGKPHPEPYLKAIQELRCSPDEILVIENAPLGIQSAKEAELQTFALTTTLDEKFLRQADRIFSSHSDVMDYVTQLLN